MNRVHAIPEYLRKADYRAIAKAIALPTCDWSEKLQLFMILE